VQTLKVKYKSTNSIKPYKNNPRKHLSKHIAEIKKSIHQFGFNNPILLDENDEIIAGHGRFYAAKELKLDKVPVIILDHLKPEEKRLYRIADNKLTENGQWDVDLLAIEFKDLSSFDIGIDLEITGFTTTQIDLSISGQQESYNEKDDALPESNVDNPIARKGDIWLLGKHKIICGDATSEETFFNLLAEEKASMIFTDPPYNVKIDGHVCGLGDTKHREFMMASGEMSDSEFQNFLKSIITNLKTFSKDGSLHYLCMDWRHIKDLLEAGEAIYSALKNICVWNKDNGGMGSLYRSKHELIAVFKSGTAAHINNIELGANGRYRTNVWDYPGINSFKGNQEELSMHPTVKPVAMIADAILDTTKRKDIVLDCFLGSGSTLIAAEKTGRICYGIELDPIYIDVIIKRFEKYTGLEAIHLFTQKTFQEIKEVRSEKQK
jgi:DNA modification methylase